MYRMGKKGPKKLKTPTYADRQSVLESLGFRSYQEYLHSKLWYGIRNKVYAKHGRSCHLCDSPADAIHHTSYDEDTLLGKTLCHLYAVCKQCHNKVELFPSGQKRTLQDARREFYKLHQERYGGPKLKKQRKPRQPSAHELQKERVKVKLAEFGFGVGKTEREIVTELLQLRIHYTLAVKEARKFLAGAGRLQPKPAKLSRHELKLKREQNAARSRAAQSESLSKLHNYKYGRTEQEVLGVLLSKGMPYPIAVREAKIYLDKGPKPKKKKRR